jgi:hypothetical protein
MKKRLRPDRDSASKTRARTNSSHHGINQKSFADKAANILHTAQSVASESQIAMRARLTTTGTEQTEKNGRYG